MGEVDIFSPAGNNRIRFYPGMNVFLKERQECFPHLWERVLLFSWRIAQERIASAFVAAGFAAGFLVFIFCPEPFTASWAMLADEAFLFEEWELVSFCWERFFNHEMSSAVVYCSGVYEFGEFKGFQTTS